MRILFLFSSTRTVHRSVATVGIPTGRCPRADAARPADPPPPRPGRRPQASAARPAAPRPTRPWPAALFPPRAGQRSWRPSSWCTRCTTRTSSVPPRADLQEVHRRQIPRHIYGGVEGPTAGSGSPPEGTFRGGVGVRGGRRLVVLLLHGISSGR